MAAFAEKIGTQMRKRREELKESDPRWTQEYAARQLPGNISGTQWARWERGENMPREDTVKEIAKVLNVRMDDLYGGSTESRRESSAGAIMPYRAEDIARAERMEAKLDMLLADRGLEWLEPESITPGSTAALKAAGEAAAKVARKSQPKRSKRRTP